MTTAEATFSVLVFEMAHTGEPDAERTIFGFGSAEHAVRYAEARVRDSVEELRRPGITAAELRSIWHIYGEDCVVPGGVYAGRDHLDAYIANPAAAVERDWKALEPCTQR